MLCTGKLLPDVTNFVHQKGDCLAILVMSEDTEKLLGVPKISKGTGAAMAEATLASLVEWGIKEHVIGMCFETTSSNSEIHTGACTLIEMLLQKELLYLACYHHIDEINHMLVKSHLLYIIIIYMFRKQFK